MQLELQKKKNHNGIPIMLRITRRFMRKLQISNRFLEGNYEYNVITFIIYHFNKENIYNRPLIK